ncbi:cilia- and flagella-associated protein 97-like [Acipenser ruthenus]|uniref:cilia- and flagella-associated protein 97-like n=1 Tax=Acipenser ruthenus TaxID=7906 RepID=UPI002742506D|nr:cilia- and flagella-associated protein 97-like [Acipenser ruthenus]XP_058854237.1 cilia- and flagella-associated protein 97-like [Acipenser ruthenus]XP_058854242.1 cilia- and flagella-associated protein 97-like [Acipenser ruthenus]XP_058854248.1 cilia- and flagella-associated protein 97-like [Acipenser ruthenus]XP_058854257.1 cilia- and flagella-associated protein 97-like [Acipenser ruthenus]
MDSPKDLEGEVDHSFFDSDDGEEQGKDLKEANNSKPQKHNELKQTSTNEKGTSKLGRDGNREEIREGQEERESCSGSVKEECNLSASSFSLSSLARSEASRGNLEGASGSQIKIPEKIRSCSSAEEREDDDDDDDESEDGYNRSEEDSEEEPDQEHSRCKPAHHNSSKKVSSKNRNYSPASSSESESSSSESESYTSPRKKSAGLPLSSPRHRSKLYLMSRKDKARLLEESEDTVTDVTPLSTPDVSPVQSFDLAMAKEDLKKQQIKKQRNVGLGLYGNSGDYYSDEGEKRFLKTQKERCNMSGNNLASSVSLESGAGSRHDQKLLSDAMDLNQLLKAFMHLESKKQKNVGIDYPERKSRKNFSFSNEDVRRIDQENQRLLRELSRQARPPSKSPKPKKPANPPARLYHSALNRQREQQRIERENMAFLKRLESAKPTLGMKRSEQLSDYQRQMRYMGSVPLGRMSSAGGSTRSASVASHCRERPSISTTAVSRPSRAAEARAAWS